MAVSDPLSLLLGKKKEELSSKPPAPAVSQALAPPRVRLDDVALSLGGARDGGADGGGLFGRPAAEAPPLASGGLFGAPDRPAAPAAPVAAAAAAGPAPAAGGPPPEGLLAGEKVHVEVRNCYFLVANPIEDVPGRLQVTNFRLKFQPSKGALREELRWMQEVRLFDVPLGLVEEAKDSRSAAGRGASELRLKVATKDFRSLDFLLPSEGDMANVVEAIRAFGTPGNPTLLFAFKHAEQVWSDGLSVDRADGWHVYDPVSEYSRMGVETDMFPNPASPWKLSGLNEAFGLCASYPARLVLPRRLTEPEIRAVAGFRKRGRIPAMSWCGGPEMRYASLWRCSQTTEGIMGQKCVDDQRMVEHIRRGPSAEHDRDLLVVDLRPWKSAWANKAGGGGFEGYRKCRLVFGGIDNIHRVREGWRAMGAAVSAVSEGEVGSWLKDVANSYWYDYIGAIMSTTLKVVRELLDFKSSVMVHCSDGWDRTAQATSLSMLCLDPHYRTQVGFLQLIQKEWCSFGHRFRTRLALGEQPSDEYSPVFIQWLECVYQLLQQFPDAFEYTPEVLLRLASEVQSNLYGTFLCDAERERVERVQPFTISLWSVLLRPEEAVTWRNSSYAPVRGPVVPSVSQVDCVTWDAYWWRYHPHWRQRRAGAPRGAGGARPPTAPAPAREAQPPAAPPPAAGDEPSLFSAEELGASPAVRPGGGTPWTPPSAVFGDDDLDDDVFSKKRPEQRAARDAWAGAAGGDDDDDLL